MSRSFLQDLSRAFSRFSGAQLQEIAVSTYSIQLGQYDYNPRSNREKKKTTKISLRSGIVIVVAQDRTSFDGDFLQLRPREAGKSSG